MAPVCSPEEAEEIISAGADELYCGAMFDEWVRAFGESDLISRRQGRRANVRDPGQLERLRSLGYVQ